jgi:hypothetical protein
MHGRLFHPLPQCGSASTDPSGHRRGWSRNSAYDGSDFRLAPRDRRCARPRQSSPVRRSGIGAAARDGGHSIGRRAARTPHERGVAVEAADGYKVVFALAEVDPAFATREIILAFKRDGKPMDAREGPLRIVAPGDKRPARWIRQVTTLKIVTPK